MANEDLPDFENTDPTDDSSADRSPASTPDPSPNPSPTPSPEPSGPEDQQQAQPTSPPAFENTQPVDQDQPPAFENTQDLSPYQGTEQHIIGDIEAAGRGIIPFGLSTEAETHLLGVNPQDIAGRQAALGPEAALVQTGATVGSALLGTGEAALFAKAADAAAGAVGATGLAAKFLSNTFQTAAFLGSNAGEKVALGQNVLDPNETASHALLNDGAISILGGVGGTAIEGVAAPILQKIADSQMGSKAAQFMSNLGSRLKFWQAGGGDMVGAFQKQMEDVQANIGAAREAVYGPTAVKGRNVQLLTQEDGIGVDQVTQHLSNVNGAIQNLPTELANNPDAQWAIQKFQNATNTPIDPITLQPTITPKTPDQIFTATDQLKRDIGKIAFEGNPLRLPSQAAQDQAGGLYSTLKSSLEDQDVWGRAAQMQKGMNDAFTQFKPANDNIIGSGGKLGKFTSKDAESEAGKIISTGKSNTYINNLGKAGQKDTQEMLGSWINKYEDWANQVNSLHAQLGIESPIAPVPTDIIKQSTNAADSGSSAADWLYQKGLSGVAQRAALGTAGAIVGGEGGGGVKGAIEGGITGLFAQQLLAPAIDRGIRSYAVPFAIKALSSGFPETMGSMLRYGESAARGASKLSTGINALFKSGGTKAIEAEASASDKDKIDDYVSNGELNNQLQEQTQAPAPTPLSTQHFAEGGEVKNPQNEPTPASAIQPVLKSVSGISKAMPDHAAVLAGAKVRVANYLNSVRPQKHAPKLAFDDVPHNAEQHRSYQKALDLAAQPLGVLNHMKAGTLTPELLKHFHSMWPELHDHISKKLTERITKAQMDDEKPSYRVRQSMSLFLGAPLDATLSPQAIQSVQAMYAAPQASPPPGVPPKRQKNNTSKLGEISKDHYTQEQAAAQRTATWN